MLKLKVKGQSLCLLQVYVPNAVREYQAFLDVVNHAFQRVGSTILLGILTHTVKRTMRHEKTWIITVLRERPVFLAALL